ncbi:MAG: cytochrome c peroxidase [Akkermansiaceae bacterium]|jgi:cytochrome c peroxidase
MKTKALALTAVVGLGLAWLHAQTKEEKTSGKITLKVPAKFPKPQIPADNELTRVRSDLGERLFHDTILSIDGTVSCAACHVHEFAFGDDVDRSRGFAGRLGKRNSPPLFNLAWKPHFFLDGRVSTVREQVLEPIQNHLEMAASLRRVLYKLNRNSSYRSDFEAAYGPGPITSEKLALALENYLLTIVSTDSKFDRVKAGTEKFTPKEQRGHDLFFKRYQDGGAGCFQCHSGPDFTDHQFRNNGLKPDEDLLDQGRARFTGKKEDRWKFSTPTLRNIALTSPYMHDGRYRKLKDAVAHYQTPLHPSPTLASELKKEGLKLDKEDLAALVAFLETLTDPQFVEEEIK